MQKTTYSFEIKLAEPFRSGWIGLHPANLTDILASGFVTVNSLDDPVGIVGSKPVVEFDHVGAKHIADAPLFEVLNGIVAALSVFMTHGNVGVKDIGPSIERFCAEHDGVRGGQCLSPGLGAQGSALILRAVVAPVERFKPGAIMLSGNYSGGESEVVMPIEYHVEFESLKIPPVLLGSP